MPVTNIRLVREEPSLDELIHQLNLANIEADNITNRRQLLTEQIMEQLKVKETKSETVDNPIVLDEQLRVVYVSNRRLSVDSDKVRSVLGRSYTKVRSDTVDKAKLDSYIATVDEVTKAKLNDCVSVTEHPYVRLYHLRKSDGETT